MLLRHRSYVPDGFDEIEHRRNRFRTTQRLEIRLHEMEGRTFERSTILIFLEKKYKMLNSICFKHFSKVTVLRRKKNIFPLFKTQI